MTQEPKSQHAASCPRCGYDLRGELGTWSVSCPLHGRCVECGLEFAWVDVLRPDLGEPLWCVEMHLGRWPLLQGAWQTFKRSWRPWLFWSRLQMHHPIRRDRLIRYVLLLALITAGLYMAQQAIVAVRVHTMVSAAVRSRLGEATTAVQKLRETLPQRLGNPTQEQLQDALNSLADDERFLRERFVVGQSLLQSIGESVFRPLSSQSASFVRTATERARYPSPIERYGLLVVRPQETSTNSATVLLVGADLL